MRFARLVLSFLLILSSSPRLSSQQSTAKPQRDPQATVLLQISVRSMGGMVPSDSIASGNTLIVEGSLTSSGPVRVLTRGTNQTSIQFQTTNVNWSLIYSNGEANRVDATGTKVLPLELAASSQSLYFPFPFLAGILNNPDISLQYVGQESLDLAQANHIRVQNTFASLFRLSWNWRQRSSVKITERTYEEGTEGFHTRRKSSHLEAASCGQSTRLGAV